MRDDAHQKYTAAKHYFGTNAGAYEQRRAQKSKWSEENRLVQHYVACMPRGSSVLDVPFGTGRFALAYIAAGLEVTGVDISGDMIAQAREHYGSSIEKFDLRVAPAEKLPFPSGSFDYLICNRFIKWLPSEAIVETVAREFRRVCRKEILVQVKLSEAPAAALVSSLRRPIARLFRKEDQKRSTARYTMQQLERCFLGDEWSLAGVIDASSVGNGVKYLILRHS